MRALLLGGSKSGKSNAAQRLAVALAAGNPRYYWATMEPVDEEDLARVQRHLEDRAGLGFQTVERGMDLPGALALLDPRGTVLLDSVTALLANEMFQKEMDALAPERVAKELLLVSRSVAHMVCVCDDIFRDAGRYDPATEAYRRGLAQICRALASEFDVVCELVLGRANIFRGKEIWEEMQCNIIGI